MGNAPMVTDETRINAELDTAGAQRYEGDAAALIATAREFDLDEPQLVWWIRDPARRPGWAPSDLKRWAQKYRDVLEQLRR